MDRQNRNEKYLKYVEEKSPKAGWFHSLFHAFIVGATVCCLGQMFSDIIRSFYPMMDLLTLGSWISIIVITLTILLTAFGCFDKIAKFGGQEHLFLFLVLRTQLRLVLLSLKKRGLCLV